MAARFDAVVIGSGPNGLAAAVELLRAGRSVLVREAADTLGGGLRSEELTLPGFVHDTCSAIHPFADSPFLRTVPLARYGATWVLPPAALAHPLDDGTAVVLERSVDETAAGLGADGDAYRRLLRPLVTAWRGLEPGLLGPLVRFPERPLEMARFGFHALRPARQLAEQLFDDTRARALFAGIAAHSTLPLERMASASFGLVLGIAGHAAGWPLPRGGSQRVADALAAYARSLGGEIATGAPVESLAELAGARTVLCDVSPAELLRLAGPRLPRRYRGALARFRHGPAAFKLDWALARPIPWRAAECARAATVHLGGSLEEIAASERAAWEGRHARRPFVLLVQPSLFDPSRAPEGKHTAWAYCHVPNGSTTDMTERVERQLERFAPGFRDTILARSILAPADLERRNRNLVGGDIAGGANNFLQLIGRPIFRPVPYRTPLPGVYLCSSSTPPGAGVHGMCGQLAARAAVGDDRR